MTPCGSPGALGGEVEPGRALWLGVRVGGTCGPSLPWIGAHQALDSPISTGLPREDRAPRWSGECQQPAFPAPPPVPAPPTPRHQGISRIASGWGGAGVTGQCSLCSHAMRGHRDLTVSQSAGRPGGGWPPRRKRREGERAARGGGGEQRAGPGTPPPRDSTFLCLQGESGEPGPKGQVSPAAVTPPSPAPAAPPPPLVASAPLGTRTATPPASLHPTPSFPYSCITPQPPPLRLRPLIPTGNPTRPAARSPRRTWLPWPQRRCGRPGGAGLSGAPWPSRTGWRPRLARTAREAGRGGELASRGGGVVSLDWLLLILSKAGSSFPEAGTKPRDQRGWVWVPEGFQSDAENTSGEKMGRGRGHSTGAVRPGSQGLLPERPPLLSGPRCQ